MVITQKVLDRFWLKPEVNKITRKDIMTNYSQDEDDRRRDRQERADRVNVFAKERNRAQSVEIGKDETPQRVVDIEITDDDFRKLLFTHMKEILLSIKWWRLY